MTQISQIIGKKGNLFIKILSVISEIRGLKGEN